MSDWKKEFREQFKCIDKYCDGQGNKPYQVGEGEWEAEQCQFHVEYLFPIEAFIEKQIENKTYLNGHKEGYERGEVECRLQKIAMWEKINTYEVYDDEPDNCWRIISEMKSLLKESIDNTPIK